MTALLLSLVYLVGFAFFVGYARGWRGGAQSCAWTPVANPTWAEAFLHAAKWPIGISLRLMRGEALLALAIVLAAAAPARAATFDLSVTTSGPAGAHVTSSPAGLDCPSTCTFAFPQLSTVTLTATFPSTMTLTAWGPPCGSSLRSCQVTLSANTTVTPFFVPLLSVSLFGTGIGSVTAAGQPPCSNTSGRGCVQLLTYPHNSEVVLTASTGPYSSFTGWSGYGGCSTASTCTVTTDAYYAITGTFTASAASYPLLVTLPNGGGAVTSSPAGISCPGVCRSTFTAGAAVTLATAASSGYRFAGWANGGCARDLPCVVNSTSPLQGLPSRYSPAAYFYPVAP